MRASKLLAGLLSFLLSVYAGGVVSLGFDLDCAPSLILFAITFIAVIRLLPKIESLNLNTFAPTIAPPPLLLFSGLAILYLGVLAICGSLESADSIAMWQQIRTGRFDDWMPVIYSWMIWAVSCVVRHETCILALQCLLCAGAVTYLYTTLCRYGYRKWVVLSVIALVGLNPSLIHYCRILAKDTLYAIIWIVLISQLISVVCTHGEWLRRWYNLIALVLILFLATFVRHNGLSLMLLLLPILPFLCSARQYVWRALTVVLLTVALICGYIGLKGALRNRGFVVVGRTGQSFVEMNGLPMNMLARALYYHPEAVPSEAADFFHRICSQETLEKNYLGYIDSIKCLDGEHFERYHQTVNNVESRQFYRMIADVVRALPGTCINAARYSTSFGWSPFAISAYHYGFAADSWVGREFLAFRTLMGAPGLHLLILLTCAVVAFRRGRWRVALVAIPFVAYTLAMTILLPGFDIRFFLPFSLIVWPFALLLLTEETA